MLTMHAINSAKRVTFFFICDASGSTKAVICGKGRKSPNVLINANIHEVIRLLSSNPQLLARAELVFIAYSDTMKILVDKNAGTNAPPKLEFVPFEGGDESNRYGYKPDYFIPIIRVKDNPPTIEPTSGCTYTAHAIEAACHLRLERSKDILSQSICDVSPSEFFVMTDGDRGWQESSEYKDQVIKMANDLAYAKESDKKIIPVVIGLGNQMDRTTQKTLARFSEPVTGENAFFWIKGESDGNLQSGIEKLYKFIGPSLVATSNYIEDSIDTLLENLRQQVREVCPDLISTVS